MSERRSLTDKELNHLCSPQGESMITITALVEQVEDLLARIEAQDAIIEKQYLTILNLRQQLAQHKTLH